MALSRKHAEEISIASNVARSGIKSEAPQMLNFGNVTKEPVGQSEACGEIAMASNVARSGIKSEAPQVLNFGNVTNEHVSQSEACGEIAMASNVARSGIKSEAPQMLQFGNVTREPVGQSEQMFEAAVAGVKLSNVKSEWNVRSCTESEGLLTTSTHDAAVKEHSDGSRRVKYEHSSESSDEGGSSLRASRRPVKEDSTERQSNASDSVEIFLTRHLDQHVPQGTSISKEHLEMKREYSTRDETPPVADAAPPKRVKEEVTDNEGQHQCLRGILQPIVNMGTMAMCPFETLASGDMSKDDMNHILEIKREEKTESIEFIPATREGHDENIHVDHFQQPDGSIYSDAHSEGLQDGSDLRENKNSVRYDLRFEKELEEPPVLTRLRKRKPRKSAWISDSDTDLSEEEDIDQIEWDKEGVSDGHYGQCLEGYTDKNNESRLRDYLLRYKDKGVFPKIPSDDLFHLFQMIKCSGSGFMCKTCGQKWNCPLNAAKHVYAHAKSSRSWCAKCGRVFKATKVYEVHLELHRLKLWREIDGAGFGKYTCQMCNRVFQTKYSLHSHMTTHKNEVLPYRCGCCDKTYKDSQQRGRHEMRHCMSDKRTYACTLCDKTFRIAQSLNRHMRYHASYKADIEAYACDLCPETFTCGNKLRLHKMRHKANSVICDKCGRVFVKQYHFEFHRPHCGTQPTKPVAEKFQCDVCGKEFGKKQVMKRHKLIHTGARPFECKHCGMRFNQSAPRDRHETLHFKNGQYRDVTKHNMKVKEGKDGRKYVSQADSD